MRGCKYHFLPAKILDGRYLQTNGFWDDNYLDVGLLVLSSVTLFAEKPRDEEPEVSPRDPETTE